VPTVNLTAAAPTFASAGATASAATSDVSGGQPDLAQQRIRVLALAGNAPSQLEVSPEGAGTAQVQLWSDSALGVSVSKADGEPDSLAVVTATEQDGAHVTVVSLPAGDGAARFLNITSGVDTTIGVLTYVEPGVVHFGAQVVPSGPNEGSLVATVTGVSAENLAHSTVHAVVSTATGTTPVALQAAGGGVYQATVPLIPGGWTSVDVNLDGPISRTTTTGAVTADGSAQIVGSTGDRLIDADDDGTLDTLAVDVAVHTDEPGTFELVADFSTGQGVAFSAPGTAVLAAGDGVLTLHAPVAALIAGGSDGPYTLTHGVLTRTSGGRARVATADSFGTTGSYPMTSLPVDGLGLYTTTLQLDPTGTALVAGARAAVVEGGTYRVAGTLTGPTGEKVNLQSVDVDLPAGVSYVALTYNATGLIAGTYTIGDLSISAAENPDNEAIGAPATFDLTDPSQPAPDSSPTVRSTSSLTLTNQFRTTGPDGDVVTAGDFACNSSVHISGSVTAAGNVSMTNDCQVDGDVRSGGSVTLDATAAIGGDLVAVGDVTLQSTVTVSGSVSAGGSVTSIDSRSVAQLQESGAIGGAVSGGLPIEAPTIPASTSVTGPDDNWPGFTTTSWQHWMNQIAAANSAPSWSPGLTASPGCVMAPWGASVNGTDALIASPTVIDARQGTTGCSNGVTLQGMTLRLGADLVVYADQLSVINGLNIQSLDGKAHELRLLVPTTTGACRSTVPPHSVRRSTRAASPPPGP